MKFILPMFFGLLCWNGPLSAQLQAAYFMDHPTLTPDGQTVIFTFETDLWQVPSTGGRASRLTAMEGVESHAKVSPDGQWLAFTSNQNDNNDIFVMPLEGGAIRQLTYHQAGDELTSWDWDSQTLYFTSSRYNRMSTYSVSIEGGTPKRLFGHYHNIMHNVVKHPETGELFFNETWESSTFQHRKGYKGAYNPDIKSYNPITKEYQEYTDHEGKDFGVTIDQNGNVYFLSDEYNGEYNLYQLENGAKKRLTDYTTSARHPHVNANGSKIVFQKDYQLFLYDTEAGTTSKIDVQILRNPVLEKTQDFDVSGEISAFDVADDGKKMAFVSRGELFVSDVKGKFIKQLETDPLGRVLEVNWLKGDTTLIFSQTVGGYQNWFTIKADGSAATQQLTDDSQNNRNFAFNSDKTKAAYLSGRNEVRLMDLETMESELLLEEELWGFYNDVPRFSPDDRYLVFSAYRNFERDIFVYDLENKEKTNLTKTGLSEYQPFWSPDGKYLFFASNRTGPNYPRGTGDAKLFRLPLQKFDEPYKSDKFEELFEKEEEDKEENDEDKEEDENDDEEVDEDEEVEVVIDFEDVIERMERIGPRFGSQNSPYVIQDDEKTIVLYGSNHDEGDSKLWKTVFEPFESPETKEIEGAKTASVDIQTAKDKHYLLFGGDIYTLNLEGNKVEKIEVKHKFQRQLQAEFEQMFYETWANLEENFYNETFHGVDWQAMREKYEAYLPHLNNRADLRLLLNDMLGELNTSHFGFYSSGDEEDVFYGFQTMATGLDFATDNPYQITHIVKNGPADKVNKDIEVGDVLVAVNGKTIDPAQNREMYFTQAAQDAEITLTLERNDQQHNVKLHPTSYTSVRNNRYDEWVAANQKRVDKQTDEQVAYVHMKNMGGGELNNFMEEMTAEGYHRKAIILDLRYNTGGNVHNDVLQFLSQRPYLQWKYRGGAMSSQPHFAPAAKPIVLLINEQSLSDAEMTAQGFKELKLGTIIGTETYRWIIFTSGKGLVDGSFYRLPSWGCYTLDGKNLERTGVAPHISVENTFVDRIEGNDPQLDRAITELLQQLD